MPLKNCPCCSGKAELLTSTVIENGTVKTKYKVMCTVCRMSTPECGTNFEAFSIWDKRPDKE